MTDPIEEALAEVESVKRVKCVHCGSHRWGPDLAAALRASQLEVEALKKERDEAIGKYHAEIHEVRKRCERRGIPNRACRECRRIQARARFVKVVHKRAVLEGGFVCGWHPRPGAWQGTTDTFWDRVTCKRCLKLRNPVVNSPEAR